MMGCCGLHLIPLAIFLLMPILFAITFGMAVHLNHINAFYAYISDTGTIPPEMCVFGLGLSMAMILGLMFTYIRYRQVDVFLEREGRPKTLNRVGAVFGCMCSFGICIVGSFQETNALEIHILGAALSFLGGSIFFIIEGCLTKTMAPAVSSKWMGNVRIGIGVLCTLLYLTCQGAGVMSLTQFKHTDPNNPLEVLKWEPKHGAWGLRITSTVTEWIMFGFFQLYFLTFVPEFKKISYTPPQFEVEFNPTSSEKEEPSDDKQSQMSIVGEEGNKGDDASNTDNKQAMAQY